MAGQVFSVASEGGYAYTDELSDVMRMALQPLTKFRQLCDMEDGADKGLHAGNQFTWNVYSNVGTQGRRLAETSPIPQTAFSIAQRSLTVYEAGNSVPYTGKLADLAKHDVVSIVDKTLKEDARKYFDIEAFLQMKTTKAHFAPASGNSATAITLETAGTCTTTNALAMNTGHVKAIVDTMKERNVPPYAADDYIEISHPSTHRAFKNTLEAVKQYTETGLAHIFNGEIGRYEGVRFIEQTFIPKGGAVDSTTFDPWTGTADAWNGAVSSWAFFMGGDTCTEAVCIPEELRASIPSDFGRSKALAWYYLGGFGLAHDVAADTRIFMWDSAA